MAKYLERVPLDVSINWRYLHQDAEKTYSEISKMRSYEKEGKTACSTKEKYLTINQALARRDK